MNLELNDTQAKFFEAMWNDDGTIKEDHYSEYCMYGAYGCGKSVICSLMIMLACFKYPKTNGLICRATYRELIDSCKKIIIDMFPPETWQYEYKAGEQCLDFKNGSKIVLRAFDDPQKVRSTTYDIAYVSQAEEISSLL